MFVCEDPPASCDDCSPERNVTADDTHWLVYSYNVRRHHCFGGLLIQQRTNATPGFYWTGGDQQHRTINILLVCRTTIARPRFLYLLCPSIYTYAVTLFFLCIIMGRMENNTKISNDLLAFFITAASLLVYCSAGRLRLRNHHFPAPTNGGRSGADQLLWSTATCLADAFSADFSLSPTDMMSTIAIATTHSTTAGNQRNSYSPSTHTRLYSLYRPAATCV